MGLVDFQYGLKENLPAAGSQGANILWFVTDAKEIWYNGKRYAAGVDLEEVQRALTGYLDGSSTVAAAITAAIESLDAEAAVARKSTGDIVTIKGSLVETNGLIGNSSATIPSTKIEGYLYNGAFYEDATHETLITGEANKLYVDKAAAGNYIYDTTENEYVEVFPDITLAKAAVTGAAEDVSYSATIGGTAITNVDDALDALAQAAGDGVAGKTIYGTANTNPGGNDYAAIYKIYQGSNGSASDPDESELKLTINIPKDQFLDEADLVDITYDDGKLYDGVTDVTELIKGAGGTATAADAGKYIKFVFELTQGSSAKSTIYLSVKSLIDVYTGGTTSEATVNVDANNEITVTIVDIAGTKITYLAESYPQVTGSDEYQAGTTYYTKDGDVYTVDNTVDAENFATKVAGGLYTKVNRESVTAALTRLDGADNVAGSVAKKVKDAINTLDAIADATKIGIDSSTAATPSNEDAVLVLQKIVETDGKFTSQVAVEVAKIGTGTGRSGSGTVEDPYVYDDTIVGAKKYAEDLAASNEGAIEDLDLTEAPIAEVSSNVVTIHGISQTDGQVAIGVDSANDIVLEEVAYTGAAADVSIADAGNYTSQTDVEGALQEIYSKLTWTTFDPVTP